MAFFQRIQTGNVLLITPSSRKILSVNTLRLFCKRSGDYG